VLVPDEADQVADVMTAIVGLGRAMEAEGLPARGGGRLADAFGVVPVLLCARDVSVLASMRGDEVRTLPTDVVAACLRRDDYDGGERRTFGRRLAAWLVGSQPCAWDDVTGDECTMGDRDALRAWLRDADLACMLVADCGVGAATGRPACGTESATRRAAAPLDDLYVGPLDRNLGCCWLSCPVRMHGLITAHYLEAPDTYDVTARLEADVLLDMEADYRACGLHLLAPWDPEGALGRAYIMMKHKDAWAKLRPILPCFADPARRLSNRAARALALLVAKRWGRNQTFILDRADELVADLDRMGGIWAAAAAADPDVVWRLMGASGDVKDMFTRLPHAALREFIADMIAWMRLSSRRFQIAVKNVGHGAGSAFFGAAPEAGRYTVFGPDELQAALEFDLRWIFFVLGSLVLKQVDGGPMGRPSTPVIAIGYTGWREQRWLSALHHGSRTGLNRGCVWLVDRRRASGALQRFVVLGQRYVDDGNVYVLHVADAEATGMAAEIVRSWYADCYGVGLVLEDTSLHRRSWDYLEGVLTVDEVGLRVTAAVLHKNHREYVLTGERPYLASTSWASCAPLAQRRELAFTRFYRAARAASECAGAVTACLGWWLELRAAGYPVRVLLRAVERLSGRRDVPEERAAAILEAAGAWRWT
jgi:hypothetical protein